MNAPRARQITIRMALMGEDEARLDREFWSGMAPGERVLETWRLSLELWRWKGWDTDEPGLRRSASRVIRS
jgi:hypothetical protein